MSSEHKDLCVSEASAKRNLCNWVLDEPSVCSTSRLDDFSVGIEFQSDFTIWWVP